MQRQAENTAEPVGPSLNADGPSAAKPRISRRIGWNGQPVWYIQVDQNVIIGGMESFGRACEISEWIRRRVFLMALGAFPGYDGLQKGLLRALRG